MHVFINYNLIDGLSRYGYGPLLYRTIGYSQN